jgi:hypothetical protein
MEQYTIYHILQNFAPLLQAYRIKKEFLTTRGDSQIQADRRNLLEFITNYCTQKRGNIRLLSSKSGIQERLLCNLIHIQSNKLSLEKIL